MSPRGSAYPRGFALSRALVLYLVSFCFLFLFSLQNLIDLWLVTAHRYDPNMPHRPSSNPKWEAWTAKGFLDASKQPPPKVPWTREEDAILLHLMVSYTDVQEYQTKMWERFASECKERSVHSPAKRDFLDILRRLQVLQKDQLKYKITLQNVKTLYWGTDKGPLWEDKSESSSTSRATKAASHSNEEQQQQQQEEEEEEDSESGEEEVVEVVKVKKKKQAKVVEVEESEDDEEEEEIAEEEANTGHNQAGHCVEAEGASQQQATRNNAATAANSQDNSHRGTKREPTLLLEAGGKRMRIGIPPKGTKVKCYPEHGSIELKF